MIRLLVEVMACAWAFVVAFIGKIDWKVAGDGWLTAIVTSVLWGAVFYWYTQGRATRAENKRVIEILHREMTQNLDLISNGDSEFISLQFYNQFGPKALISLSAPAGRALHLLYKALEMAREDPDILVRKRSLLLEKVDQFTQDATSLSKDQRQELKCKWERLLEPNPGSKKTGT